MCCLLQLVDSATSGGWMYWHPAGKLYESDYHFSYRNASIKMSYCTHWINYIVVVGCYANSVSSELGSSLSPYGSVTSQVLVPVAVAGSWSSLVFTWKSLNTCESCALQCKPANMYVCKGFCTHHASSSLAAIKLVSATQGHLRPDVLSAFLHLLRHSCVRVIGHMLDPLASNPMHSLALTIMNVLNVHESNTAFRNLRQT